jgi:glycosyltransferase involved in cell wall biosynthesis
LAAPLHVLVTADPGLPVPPRYYGGIERVIALLVEGLQRRGHRVTLVAHAESTVSCDLVPYAAPADRGWTQQWAATAVIARTVADRKPDVVQSFSRLASLLPILPWRVPKVMSYQRIVTRRAVQRARLLAGRTLTFTGCSRKLIAPVEDLGVWHVIYNAVSVETLTYSSSVPEDAPLVFLGRIEPIKGTHEAIDIARRANRTLVIAGNVPDHPDARAYFAAHVEPHVDNDRVHYIGPVDDEEKARLLSQAAALLMPVLWDEPFGIVMAEALACGTPVLGYRRGAVPEVVHEGVTGYVRDDARGLAACVSRIRALSREACRQSAEQRFSPRALVDAYARVYASVVAEARTA